MTKGFIFPSSGDAENWDTVIRPGNVLESLRLDELFRFRQLIKLMVYRDFVVYHKQTILGPLWWLLQPIVTCGVFVLVFSTVMRMSTGPVPPALFFLSGLILWFYFSRSFNSIATLYSANAGLFGKVYFPRLVVPISILLGNAIKSLLQVAFFSFVYLFFVARGTELRPSLLVLCFPLVLAYLAMLALGFGLIFNSLTYKYRDLALTIPFLVQTWMFLSSIIHPVSRIPESIRWIMCLNPVIPAVEYFRHACFGTGMVSPEHLLNGIGTGLLVLLLGLVSFAYTDQVFIDSI